MTDDLRRTINLGCRIREFHDILNHAFDEAEEELRKFKNIDEEEAEYYACKCRKCLLDNLTDDYFRIFDCYIRIFDDEGQMI